MIYGNRTNGNEHGTVYTKRPVVEYLLDLVGYTSDKNLSQYKLLEPSAGEGNFLLPALERLYLSSEKYGFEFEKALQNIYAVELDSKKITTLSSNIMNLLKDKNIQLCNPLSILYEGDFLEFEIPCFDGIIGNPPYIRYDNIPDDKKKIYRNTFLTFRSRCDIYIPFIQKSLEHLTPNGRLAFICADRWLKTQYGSELRNLVATKYDFSLFATIDGYNAFEEEVIAYPSIFLISNRKQTSPTKHYSIHTETDLNLHNSEQCNTLILFDSTGNLINVHSTEKTSSLEEQDFKIGIGVATGADKVFIGRHLKGVVEEDVLLPLITSKEVDDGKFAWRDTYIINPYKDETNKLISLNEYPKLKAYFESHSAILRKRHVAQKSNENWYKTIDRIYPSLMKKTKLLLPDITTKKYLYLDTGNFYPAHNFFYITHDNEEYLPVLGAILLTDYCLMQLTSLGNTMSGGAYRWQAQTVRKIHIPQICCISKEDMTSLKSAFYEHDLDLGNRILEKYLSTT